MSRLFDDGSSQYLRVGSAVLTSAPISVSAWIYPDAAVVQDVFSIADESASNHIWRLIARDNGEIRWLSQSGGSGGNADTSTTYSLNTWHNVIGIEASTTSRFSYLDNGGEGTNTETRNPTDLDVTSIGAKIVSPATNFFSGRICEVGVWNAVLAATSRALLAAGVSPLLVEPESLVAYWPLISDEDQDRVGGFDMTAFNAPTVATHYPGVWYASPSMVAFPAPAAGTSIPVVMNHLRQQGIS